VDAAAADGGGQAGEIWRGGDDLDLCAHEARGEAQRSQRAGDEQPEVKKLAHGYRPLSQNS
jgi:hypothetical protein